MLFVGSVKQGVKQEQTWRAWDGMAWHGQLWCHLRTPNLKDLLFHPPLRPQPPRRADDHFITPWIFFRWLVGCCWAVLMCSAAATARTAACAPGC